MAEVAVTLRVADMSGRARVRAVCACLRDLPGVRSVRADVTTGVLIVHGDVTVEQIRAAVAEGGCRLDGEPEVAPS